MSVEKYIDAYFIMPCFYVVDCEVTLFYMGTGVAFLDRLHFRDGRGKGRTVIRFF